jgi:hypothetical protein
VLGLLVVPFTEMSVVTLHDKCVTFLQDKCSIARYLHSVHTYGFDA